MYFGLSPSTGLNWIINDTDVTHHGDLILINNAESEGIQIREEFCAGHRCIRPYNASVLAGA
jgi:hypothetical protein